MPIETGDARELRFGLGDICITPNGLLAELGKSGGGCALNRGFTGCCCACEGVDIIPIDAVAGDGESIAESCGERVDWGGGGGRIGGGKDALRSFGPLGPTGEDNGCGCSAGAELPFGIAAAAADEEPDVVAAGPLREAEENRNSLRNRCI